MSRAVFFKEFVKNWQRTGSVIPSSRFLIRKCLAPIDFSRATLIVELGAGEGCITRVLLSRMRPEAKLFSFEVNPAFLHFLLRIEDRRLSIVDKNAEYLKDYWRTRGLPPADYVVSSLPLAGFPNALHARIVENVSEVLAPGGRFIQYQYSLRSRQRLKKQFAGMRLSFTPLNIPPAVVYVCTRRSRGSTID